MTLRLEYTIVFSAVALLLAHLQTFHPQFGPLTFEQSVARNIYDASAVANAVDALQGLVRPEYTVVLVPDVTDGEFDAYNEEFENESFVVLNVSPDVDAPLPLDADIVIADIPFAWQTTMEFDASIDGQQLATPPASRHVACALWSLYSCISVACFSMFLVLSSWVFVLQFLGRSSRLLELFNSLLGSTAPPPVFTPQFDIDPPVEPEAASPTVHENDFAIALVILYAFCATTSLNAIGTKMVAAPPAARPLQPSPTLLECSAARPPRVHSVTDPTALNPAATTPLSPIATCLPRPRTRIAPDPAAVHSETAHRIEPSQLPVLAPPPPPPTMYTPVSFEPSRIPIEALPHIKAVPVKTTASSSSIIYETPQPTPDRAFLIYETSTPRNVAPIPHQPHAEDNADRLTQRVPSKIVYHARSAPPPLYPPVPRQDYVATPLYHGPAFYPSHLHHVAHFGAAPARPLLVHRLSFITFAASKSPSRRLPSASALANQSISRRARWGGGSAGVNVPPTLPPPFRGRSDQQSRRALLVWDRGGKAGESGADVSLALPPFLRALPGAEEQTCFSVLGMGGWLAGWRAD
ncbi:hypothetical protein C8J57DRAFT_1530320 [Mycena rebaudengoi]|nr:hypothetical protein C8J57DRAFT_1530320 [Mycena rebaudengoi]